MVQSGEIAKNSYALQDVIKDVSEIKSNSKPKALPQIRQRPSLTSHFAGREEELNTLKTILDSYGSAPIIQYGDVGKTQIAVALAERAEKNNWTPAGTFWIRARGKESKLVGNLADFTEALTGHSIL